MNANANRSAAALAAEYWNGTAWTAVSELVDGTAYNGAALGRDGEVRFAEPASWTAATIAGTTGFWLRLSVGARLHGSTLVGGLRLREPRKADYFLTVGPELVRVSAEGGRPVVSKSVTGGPAATYTAGPAGWRRYAPGHEPVGAGRLGLRHHGGRPLSRDGIRRGAVGRQAGLAASGRERRHGRRPRRQHLARLSVGCPSGRGSTASRPTGSSRSARSF